MKKFKGLMLGDTPIYFDIGGSNRGPLLVNPNKIEEAVDFLCKATGKLPPRKIPKKFGEKFGTKKNKG